MITGVHHFALSVADAERSVAFYCGLLGLEVAADREVEGGYVATVTGIPGVRARIVMLHGHGMRLELLEYRRPRGATRSRGFADAGSAHLCFTTDDLAADAARLAAAGVAFRSAPVAVTSGPNRGGRAVYAIDPDGNAVELVQPAPQPAVP